MSHLSYGSDYPWLDGRVPDGFWNIRSNRVRYMNWLGDRLGFRQWDDWYQLRNSGFLENCGATLLNAIYGASVIAAMKDYHPQREWLAWLFSKTSKGFWDSVDHRRAYMNWLRDRLRIRRVEDWYRISPSLFGEYRGGGLLRNHYQGSVLAALQEYRSDYNWKPWLFRKVPHGYWSSRESRQQYLHWLGEAFHLRLQSDWERATKEMLKTTGGAGLFYGHYRGSMVAVRNEALTMLCGDKPTADRRRGDRQA